MHRLTKAKPVQPDTFTSDSYAEISKVHAELRPEVKFPVKFFVSCPEGGFQKSHLGPGLSWTLGLGPGPGLRPINWSSTDTKMICFAVSLFAKKEKRKCPVFKHQLQQQLPTAVTLCSARPPKADGRLLGGAGKASEPDPRRERWSQPWPGLCPSLCPAVALAHDVALYGPLGPIVFIIVAMQCKGRDMVRYCPHSACSTVVGCNLGCIHRW